MAPKKTMSQSASITDFFPRARVSASVLSSSQTFVSQAPAKQKLPPRPDQEVISVSSASHITVSSGTRSIITISDTSSARPNPGASCDPMDPMESISSRRYYVAPPKSSSAKQPARHSAASKSSFKRKAKLDSDSEIEPIEAVAYIPRSPARTRTSAPAVNKPTPFSPKENLTHQLSQPATRKKPRISSPEPRLPSPEPPIAPSEPGELVPSSQSDEQNEMVHRGPPRDPVAVMEDVDRWRNEARSPVSLPLSEPDDNMDVDMDTPVDVVVVDVAPRTVFTPEPSPQPQQQPLLLTPQQPRLQRSLPATPVALTEASKTAKIIADIKAKAYADALSSPEDSPLGELKELEDSSDEEDLISGFAAKEDPFSSPLSPLPATTRYSLRDRGESSAASTSRRSPSPSTSRRSRVPPPRGPVILTKIPKKVVPVDPLGALLREKNRADKGGKGGLALRRAEDAMRAESPLSERSDEEGAEDWTNEAAARAAVKSHGRAIWDSSSPGPGHSDSDVSLNDEDRCRLLGEKRGKAVVGILESDRAKREAAKGKQKILGVPLWEADAAYMDTDLTIPSLPDHLCGQRTLALLKSSIADDLAQAALLLNSGAFANFKLPREIISYFCELASSPRVTALTAPAFHALSQIWKRPSVLAPGMPFCVMHSTLVRLGAKQAVMDAMEWVPPPGAHPEAIQPRERDDALYRLIRLLTLSAQSAQQVPSEVPDFVLALLVVAMDPSSSPDLQRDIILTVDLLCKSLAPGTEISAGMETTICNRVIKLASGLQPINKAHLVALLAGGSGRTTRIARWVAHAVITKSTAVSLAKYNDLPPLVPLLELALSPEITGSKPETPIRGVFEVYDNADYVDMAFYVQVLAVAISNVEGYVLEETREPVAPPPPGSPGKPSAEKPDTTLTLVRLAIENLHSCIVDTRAAHLDRSRTKAALKQLSMRIHYQQGAALRSRRGKKSRPIQQYFAKPK